MTYGLDDVDRTILYYLSQDARHNSAADIAEHVRVSAQTVRNRINQLEEHGVIKGHHAQIDFERGEGYLTNLFMCTTSAKDRERLARQALQLPGIVNVREIMTGRTDLRIVAIGKDTDEIAQIARAIIDLGIEIEEENFIQREHFTPFRPYSPQASRQEPTITDFLSLTGNAEVVEFTVSEEMPIVGETLQEAKQEGLLHDDVLVVSIERNDDILTPQGNTCVEADDLVTVLSRHGIDDDLETTFSNPEESN